MYPLSRASQSWTDQSAVDRRNDVRAVTDGILASNLGAIIGRDRIAGMGHSLGGYTMFGMIGGWDSWRDARFKAAVLLSPWIQPYLVQGRIPRANPVPVMYQGGTLDLGITPSLKQGGGAYDSNQAPKFFLELRGTGHLGWTNSACGRTATTVAACLQSDTNVQLSSRNLNDFFDRYLRGNSPRFLFDKTQGLATYRRNTLGTTVSGASFSPGAPVAPESIASLFGDAFTSAPVFADRLPLPNSLGQIASISILDSRNRVFPVQLFFASPSQVNYLLPEGVAPGTATLTVRDATDVVASGTVNVDAVAPGFFTARSNGAGAPAGQILTIRPDGTRSFTELSDATGNPAPIDLTQGEVILILYGTGLRSAASSQATIAGVTVPTFGLARSAQFLGLDQLNVGPLPNTLRGAGNAELVLTLDSRRANTMQINIR
jgi:uncharacterized protein (TIGR03437 family)